MTEQTRCFICELTAAVTRVANRDVFLVECDVCGRYEIAGSLTSTLRNPADSELLPYLSAAVRQATDQGRGIQLPTTGWQELARAHRATPTTAKVRRLLQALAELSEKPGANIALRDSVAGRLTARIDAHSVHEMAYLLQHLVHLGYVEMRAQGVVNVTVPGWESLEPSSGGGVVGTCFVAMSFDRSLDSAFDDGIKPAVETDCGFTVIRIDRVPHNDNITDRILAGVRSAQFVVADFTLQRQGVHFEAGFAMGLGRPVIWTCGDTDFANVHFDTRQYNHIVWTNPADLREKLAARIRATVALAPRMAL